MQISYIISAYKLPRQLVRLVTRLNTDSASFYLHIDRKSGDEVYDAMVRGLGRLPNVHFLKRHTCYWGGFGHVAATLEGIKSITRPGSEFDYVILLTGQDYPIKTNWIGYAPGIFESSGDIYGFRPGASSHRSARCHTG